MLYSSDYESQGYPGGTLWVPCKERAAPSSRVIVQYGTVQLGILIIVPDTILLLALRTVNMSTTGGM